MNQPINIKFSAHLTESHQLKAADALISKLKQQHAADDSYIAELEDNAKKDKAEIEKLKSLLETARTKIQEVNNKYSKDVQNAVRTDIVYLKYKENLDQVKKERDAYKAQRDDLIYRINQLSKNV